MRRIFVQIIITVLFFFTPISTAHAVVLKDIEAEPGVQKTGVLIVGVSAYQGAWEAAQLGPFVMINDAYAKRLADPFIAKPGVHYVELLTGSEATSDGIVYALTALAEKKLDVLVFSYQGFGLGADTHESCFAAADWDHNDPFVTCLRATKVAPLITNAAKRRLVLLDASAPSHDITTAIESDTFGPTADDWPVKGDRDTAVVSSGRSQKYIECKAFGPTIAAVVKAIPPSAPITFGDVTTGIATIASLPPDKQPPGVATCATPLQLSVDSAWFSDVVIIPGVTPPIPTPLPVDPPAQLKRKPKPLRGPTVASLVTTGVCAAVGVGSYVAGENRLAEYNDPDWAQAHYPGDDKGRTEAANAELPIYGSVAIAGFSCAGIGAAASGLTWYFGK